MFFKRLSRSRSNSQSYVDNYAGPNDSSKQSYDAYASAPVSATDDHIDDRRDLPSSRQSNTAPQFGEEALEKETSGMYPRQSQPTEVPYASPPMSAGAPVTNGYGSRGAFQDDLPPSKPSQAPPDLLMQAFNQALRPHMDKVDQLESEIADLRAYIDQLEQQRSDVHAWIDKRGLRPGEYFHYIQSKNAEC
jgi:hypothetical protein